MFVVETLTLAQLTEELKKHGIPIGKEKAQACIEQGVFPFARQIKMSGNEYLIFRKGFEKWIQENGIEV